jgi:hypothetical protein
VNGPDEDEGSVERERPADRAADPEPRQREEQRRAIVHGRHGRDAVDRRLALIAGPENVLNPYRPERIDLVHLAQIGHLWRKGIGRIAHQPVEAGADRREQDCKQAAADDPGHEEGQEEARACFAGLVGKGKVDPDHPHHGEPGIVVQVDEEGDQGMTEDRLQPFPGLAAEVQRRVPGNEGRIPRIGVEPGNVRLQLDEDIHEEQHDQDHGKALGQAAAVGQVTLQIAQQRRDRALGLHHRGDVIEAGKQQADQHHREREGAEADCHEKEIRRLEIGPRLHQDEEAGIIDGDHGEKDAMGIQALPEQGPEAVLSPGSGIEHRRG